MRVERGSDGNPFPLVPFDSACRRVEAGMPLAPTNRQPSMTATLSSRRSTPESLTPLARHMRECARARGRWFGLGCLAERVHTFVAPRFFTTVFAVTGIVGL